MVTEVVSAIKERLLSIEAACEGAEYSRALSLLHQMERDYVLALRQAIKEQAAPTMDYEGYVREIVARENKGGRGASRAYSFTNWSDARYDAQRVQETIDRLVQSGEFVVKHQQVYTPEAWERIKAVRYRRRASLPREEKHHLRLSDSL